MATLNLFRALRVPYPDYESGFWGEQTSTLNFCEEDYALSFYCAELCNTVTNALFVWLGVKGILSCIKYSHPNIFLVAFIGYIVVGLGSISFHATLKYPMQLVDELSMIYTTCLMMYASFSFSKSRIFSVSLGIGLLGLAAFITLYYHITKDPAFHQTAYAILTATIVFRSMWVMESQLRPALEARQARKSDELLKTMWIMVITGLLVFLGGYLLWILDNTYCAQVRGIRRAIGLPWAVLLEGHAWWHLMTGLAYYYIIWGIWLRHCLTGHDDEYVLDWPRLLTSIPEVRREKKRAQKQQ
ncbi:alkaline phytoceramidase [Mariannaea sp. PMI_226]|nr:alkaline phytoceramidase [Mariannaea sp. PMI_226]